MRAKLKQSVKRALGSEAIRATRRQIRGLQIEALLASMRRRGWTRESLSMTDEQAAIHFANDVTVDEFSRLVIRLFHEFKLEFLREALGSEYIDTHTFFEIGDSDGLVLKAFGKTGFSINNDPRCIDLIRQNGVEAELGLGEGISATDKSYDVAMSFETLEHSLNPLAFMQEMTRVARERVIISIPGVTRTYAHPRVKGMRVGEEHVFEFCSHDLLNLATHLPLRLARHSKFSVFNTPTRPDAAFYYLATRTPDLFGGCFRWFDFYVFDIVDDDHGRTAAESAAVYSRRP
jgi:hypothetical protein